MDEFRAIYFKYIVLDKWIELLADPFLQLVFHVFEKVVFAVFMKGLSPFHSTPLGNNACAYLRE